MKMDCDIIKDLLPLYTESMVSEKSKEAVEEHLSECDICSRHYQQMTAPAPETTYNTAPAENFRKYVKKKKRHLGLKVALITAAIAVALFIFYLIIFGGAMGLLVFSSLSAKIEEDSDVTHYTQYMGPNATENYASKWGMDESIFPTEITESMEILDYKMVYYNPWDAQYLSYLDVIYDAADYEAEVHRLQAYESTEYVGYYGVTGFGEDYELLAMYADSYNGFVYALTDGEDEIIYVEIIFCNYFMDLDYKDYIDTKYLPLGFDATRDNPYCLEMMNSD